MVTKRVNVLWAVLGVVSGMAIGAWFAGSKIQSPAEVAARTAAPEPSPILVPVELRVLSSDVVTRGTARFGLPQPISIAPSTVKSSVGLIATVPRPNMEFEEGEVILSISGRPVFILRGTTPTYRDWPVSASIRAELMAFMTTAQPPRSSAGIERPGGIRSNPRANNAPPSSRSSESGRMPCALDWRPSLRAKRQCEPSLPRVPPRNRLRAKPLSTALRVLVTAASPPTSGPANSSRLKPNARELPILGARLPPMSPRRSPSAP